MGKRDKAGSTLYCPLKVIENLYRMNGAAIISKDDEELTVAGRL